MKFLITVYIIATTANLALGYAVWIDDGFNHAIGRAFPAQIILTLLLGLYAARDPLE